MEDKDRGKNYTIEFIEKHGGPEQVAKNTGLNRQTVRQISNGRNYPGFEAVARLMATYPDYDLKAELAAPTKTSVTRVLVPVAHEDGFGDDQEAPATETQLDPIVIRLLEFIERKGGPSKVAKVIGVMPSVIYNYQAGRNKHPSAEILQSFAQQFSDFDSGYVLTGHVSEGSVTITESSPVQDMEIAGLKREIVRLEETNSILRTIVSSQLGKDLDSVKTESTTDTTPTGQLLIALGSAERKASRQMVRLDVRDARQMGRTWPDSTNENPSRQ